MARSGDVLQHPVTGERVIWRKVAGDTGGALLQADLFAEPGGFVPAAHVHPNQEERLQVLAGMLSFRTDGQEQILRAGQVAVVPPGRPHVWWNAGEEQVHVLVEIRPALRTEMFFETFFGLAADGKTNHRGLPNPVRWAMLAREYQDELHLARPSVATQRVLFGPLAVVGRLLGYRGWYRRYSAEPLRKEPDADRAWR
jgi:quercetin dioxygenase-like cupin family protein